MFSDALASGGTDCCVLEYAGQMMPPQVQELLSAPIVLPNPYLELAVQGFSDTLNSYK